MPDLIKLLGSLEDKAQRLKMPDWRDPMLATLTDTPFSDTGWIYERKLDGERIITYIKDGNVALYTRNQKTANTPYPELVDALTDMHIANCIIDGEVVAFEHNISSFAKLQERMHVTNTQEARESNIAIFYYLFDLLYYDAYDLTDIPLYKRKHVLKHIIAYQDPIRYTQHRRTDGRAYYEHACNKGWEGIIAKKRDSFYIHSRSRQWLKYKCVHEQEFIIIGYTEPQGSRVGFGALLIAYYEDDTLTYGGKIGTGFDDKTLQELHDAFQPHRVETSPLSASEREKVEDHNVFWLEPHFVCQAGFTQWTQNGKLRHPRYLGLRRDKDPKDVVRERPQSVS